MYRYISHFPIQRERLILTPHVWSCMLVFIRSLTQCIHNRPGIISDHEQLMFKIKVWMDGWMNGWMDGWMGWMDGWDKRTDRRMDG